jgi:hypothetical protein
MFATTKRIRATVLLGLIVLAGGADGQNSASRDRQALATVQAYVATWRGVGQPKRGSNVGAWTEESTWAWRFEGGRAAIAAQLTNDKFYSSLELQAGEQPGQFVLLATATGGETGNAQRTPERFTGQRSDGVLVLTAEQPREDRPARISIRLVAGGDRMLVLYEKRAGEASYTRLAEVGSTRKGSSFAKATAGGRECVVTGGLGTIAVEHKGKKYYVCCRGCRDYFLDDPDGVLAEYRERKAAENSGKAP